MLNECCLLLPPPTASPPMRGEDAGTPPGAAKKAAPGAAPVGSDSMPGEGLEAGRAPRRLGGTPVPTELVLYTAETEAAAKS
jgi:hypothetical protein